MLVDFPGLEEYPLRGGGFPRIDMGDDSYVPDFGQITIHNYRYCIKSPEIFPGIHRFDALGIKCGIKHAILLHGRVSKILEHLDKIALYR